MPMHVVVYSKVRLFGEALSGWLRSKDYDSVASFCGVENLLDHIGRQQPDIVLVDIHGDQSMIDAKQIARTFPDIRMLAIALPEVAERVIECIDAGFNNYFPRNASLDQLTPMIEKTLLGESECSPRVAASLFEELRKRARSKRGNKRKGTLTRREFEVLECLQQGMCNKEIARSLGISVATVKNHLHNIFGKLQVNGRVQAVAKLNESPWLAKVG